jgi:hypothetical protein
MSPVERPPTGAALDLEVAPELRIVLRQLAASSRAARTLGGARIAVVTASSPRAEA